MTNSILLLISANFILGTAAGIIMHRSDYCVAGIFRDYFLFRQTLMLKTLMLLIAASMVLFELSRRLELLPHYPFPILGSPSLANIAGGIIFGIGMVLAGGCVVGTLYKMGSGSIISATALVGLIIGSAFYAEMHSWWQSIARSTAFLKGQVTLPQVFECDPLLLIVPIVLVAAILFAHWTKQGTMTRHSSAEGYLQPWKAALYLSFIGAISYILVGMPLGITTAYAKIAAYLEVLIIPMHVTENTFFSAVPLDYHNSLFELQLQGGAGPHFDAIAFIQFPVIAGIIAGAFLSATLLREFKIYYKVPIRQYLSALIGGIILALGSRMTPGCNIWHMFGGLPILAMQSIFFLIGIFPGTCIGTFILRRYVLTVR